MNTKKNTLCSLPFFLFGLIVALLLVATAEPTYAQSSERISQNQNGCIGFPLGWYVLGAFDPRQMQMALAESANEGFSFVMPYGLAQHMGLPALEAYLNDAQKYGVKVMVDLHTGDLLSVRVKETTRIVESVRDSPSLYGYYLDDEPGRRSVSAKVLLTLYRLVRRLDPNPLHRVLITFSEPIREVLKYLPATNYVGRELYWIRSRPDTWDLSSVVTDVLEAHTHGSHCYIAVPRYFTNPDLVTPWDFRYNVFAPISMGADGVLPFIFEGYIPESHNYEPEAQLRVKVVYPTTTLVSRIAPLLMEENSAVHAHITHEIGESITYRIGGSCHYAVLVAVNNSTLNDTEVTFAIHGLIGSIHKAEVLGERRELDLTNHSLSDTFLPLQVHVYSFKPRTDWLDRSRGKGIVNVRVRLVIHRPLSLCHI